MKVESETFEKHVRRLAAESPDYVYRTTQGCTYVRYGRDGEWCGDCLIGGALIACGVPANELHAIDAAEYTTDDEWELAPSARIVLRHYGISPEMADWGDIVQQHQDHRHSWGDSVRAADRLMLIPKPGRAIEVRRSVHLDSA
ncbi:hypothetical protein NONI108955_11160 [Nocardia ninae]|uniref:Uncharacterized protein n=1 Tax=Nocardia ninae NBRC 108245 TaxID=1210091 RepID=A0A511MNB5_9NOCA|nr:hypothetical protein [Nocardia ninae]GEM41941.1 hypothetical protein NN4_64600 [Nocardia ninae NBRC 108245]